MHGTQVLDCGSSASPSGNGCNGGNVARAMQYVITNGGVAAATGYPYVGSETGTCNAEVG